MEPSRRQIVVTTVGASLARNLAGPEYRDLLRTTAGKSESELILPERQRLDDLALELDHALEETGQNTLQLRRTCAELNGILALEQGEESSLRAHESFPGPVGSRPHREPISHALIATDTALGRLTARRLADCLRRRGSIVEVVVPPGLTNRSQSNFERGLVTLIDWCEETLIPWRDAAGWVSFHLSGGHKSLIGALSLVGMIYADELVFLNEDPKFGLIRIPRLAGLEQSESSEHAVAVPSTTGLSPLVASAESLPDEETRPEGSQETACTAETDKAPIPGPWDLLVARIVQRAKGCGHGEPIPISGRPPQIAQHQD